MKSKISKIDVSVLIGSTMGIIITMLAGKPVSPLLTPVTIGALILIKLIVAY